MHLLGLIIWVAGAALTYSEQKKTCGKWSAVCLACAWPLRAAGAAWEMLKEESKGNHVEQ